MKKFLLSLALMSVASITQATYYKNGAKLTAAPTTETKVIIEGWTRANKGFMTTAPEGTTTFAILDKQNTNRTVFTDEYVYTLIPVEGSTTDFYIKDHNDKYAPICTKNLNAGGGKQIEGTDNISEAGTYKIGAQFEIATTAYSDKYMLTNTNQTALNHAEVHFDVVSNKFVWCYLETPELGQKDAGNSSRTACAFIIRKAVEVLPIDVTFNYPAFGGEQLSITASMIPGLEVAASQIPAVEYFTATGIEGDATVSETNNAFTVTGTWNFPFTLNKVFRANIRNYTSRWAVNDQNEISTNSNDNANAYAPENLFYLKGHGFNADNRLIVTLHSIAFDDTYGFNCGTGNNNVGTFTQSPTNWYVSTNTNSTANNPGISLQHSGNTNAFANDISSHLGIWANGSTAQNDGGSFIRFFDLTDSDFATYEWEHDGSFYVLNAEKQAIAQADPTSENVREVFDSATLSPSATLTVTLTYEGRAIGSPIEVSGIVGTEHTIPTPVFFKDEITVTIPQTDGSMNYPLTKLALPFKHTANTDNMVWQAIQIQASYKDNRDYTWTFSEADSDTMVQRKPADLATNGFADTQLWAFVGNIIDGFKIYNKAAGTGMWLYGEGLHAKVGTNETNSIWTPYVNTANLSNETYCCFKADGTTYINLDTGKETTLSFWGTADQGSSCWFIAPAEPMLPTAKGLDIEPYNGPMNAVGAVDFNGIDFNATIPAIIAEAEADKYDIDAAEALRNEIARYNSNVTVNQLQPNGYYRIQNILFSDEYVYTSATDTNLYSTKYLNNAHRTNYHTIFKFEPVSGQTGRYYLKSQGHYVGHISGVEPGTNLQGPTQTLVDNERGEFSLVIYNHDDNPDIETRASFAIKDMTQSDYNSFHQGRDAGEGSYRISAWRQFAHGSHFYVLKAEHIDVVLTHAYNDMYIGFGYFPFAVSAPDEDTKLYYVHESNDRETGEPVITYSEVTSVPAHTAFMVSHKNATTATLAIGEVAAANVRRRAIAVDGDNKVYDGFTDTDSWWRNTSNLSDNSWTTCENIPEQITALNVSNVRYMERTMTFNDGGDLTADFMYTAGNERLDICGVALYDAEGNTLVSGDFHTGFSGNQKVNKEYTVKVPAAGTYILRYYCNNGANKYNTAGDIYLTFASKDHTNLLDGYLRLGQAKAGDYVFGDTSKGIGFSKVAEPADVAGNYVYIPAENLYHQGLAQTNEIPLVDSNSTTTEISELNAEKPAAKVIYDLQGRRMNAPVKGFNIINGAKVFVK